jgi:hypothetical protein
MAVGAASEVESGEVLARSRRLVVRLWTALLVVAWSALSLHPDYGSDAFFHWMLGREVLRTHARVVTERWALPELHATCAVPEWLWDIGAWLVQRTFGAGGSALLVLACAALAAWACCRLAASVAHEAATVVLVTACISPLVLARIQDRPETAVMVFVPSLLVVAAKLANAGSARERAIHAAQIVALMLLWAQVHPSFILVPILVAIVAGESVVRADRRLAVGLVVALGLASLSSAQGATVLAYTWKHASSYAVSHVSEWSPPTWDMLDPTRNVHLPPYAALWFAALVGIARGRRLPRRQLALALFGLFLVVRGRRNLGLGAELLVPFAVDGLDALFAGTSARVGRAAVFASLAFAVALFARLAVILDTEIGPLGTFASADALFPAHAAAFLARAPEGTRVLTTYDAGAPLAFWLDGHVRTSLDGRTLLYFSDPEFAVARASWEDAHALEETLRMDSFDAAVVERTNSICALLAARSDWEPAVVEATYTTFVRKGAYRGGGIGHLAPCGGDRFTTDACDDGGAAVVGELDALAGDPFLDAMRVEARVRCGLDARDADALVAMLPPRARAAGFLAERDGLFAWILAHAGRVDDAVDLVAPYVAKGDVGAASRVAWVLDARGDPRLRPMLERLLAIHDDAAPAWIPALLADACAREGKLDCAATYGMFAAAKGEGEVSPALCAVSSKHPDSVTRAEAARWLDALRRDAKRGANGATSVAPACP